MITKTKTISPLVTSSEMESSEMGMDENGVSLATYFLRDKIYSDKIRAVCREYFTNALDEQIKYSVSRPVEISLIENRYSVRDFAKGLSEDGIRNIFGMYFRSTKTTNNQQSGMFGLGSKSLFSYTDSFYVKSFFEGVCTLYCCTLAPGKNGIPVGTILKISEEETNETGLEVSCEIKSADSYTFENYIREMVQTCSIPVKFICGSEEFFPEVPLKEAQIGEYTIRLFKSQGDSELYLSMGNVTYQKLDRGDLKTLNISALLKEDCILHVSIPIGKMSLPISRESFETTPANARELENLYAELRALAEREAAPLKDLSWDDILKECDKPRRAGEFFDYSPKNLYPDIYSVIQSLDQGNSKFSPTKKDGKVLVALIPNKRSAEYWIEKVTNHCRETNQNFYYLREQYISKTKDNSHLNFEKLEAAFLFKPAKHKIFNWIKKEKGETEIAEPAPAEYTIKWKIDNGYGRNRYTVEKENWIPLERHEALAEQLNLQESEPKVQIENFLKTFNNGGSHEELNKFLIHFSTKAQETGVTISNQEGFDEYLALGWYTNTDPRYVSASDKIRERKKKEMDENSFISSIKNRFNFMDNKYQSKIIKIGRNRRHRIDKLSNKLEEISKEKTLRGKILHKMRRNDYYYGQEKPPIFSRQDLRKVLALTNS